jgi:hypothetical protein
VWNLKTFDLKLEREKSELRPSNNDTRKTIWVERKNDSLILPRFGRTIK